MNRRDFIATAAAVGVGAALPLRADVDDLLKNVPNEAWGFMYQVDEEGGLGWVWLKEYRLGVPVEGPFRIPYGRRLLVARTDHPCYWRIVAQGGE